jgi:hypothetical protein
MRTFPKSLGVFQQIVNERGERLRQLSFDDLEQLVRPSLEGATIERLTVETRPARIGIIVQPRPDGKLRVVVQGFMAARFMPLVKLVALDGFYKRPDETVDPMPDDEFCEFD